MISVASASYMFARMHVDDLNWHTRAYSMWAAYEESKLAILLFVYELNRRGITAYASDPGVADSDVTRAGHLALGHGKLFTCEMLSCRHRGTLPYPRM